MPGDFGSQKKTGTEEGFATLLAWWDKSAQQDGAGTALVCEGDS